MAATLSHIIPQYLENEEVLGELIALLETIKLTVEQHGTIPESDNQNMVRPWLGSVGCLG